MSEVHEGPAAPVDFDADEPKPAELPFAFRLRKHLEERGAVIAHEYTQGGVKMGACGVEAGLMYTWTQLHVARDDMAEKLAEGILERFGPHITFGDLVVPRGGQLECVSMARTGNVSVRHIVHYEIVSDRLQQRWDVIVRKTNR